MQPDDTSSGLDPREPHFVDALERAHQATSLALRAARAGAWELNLESGDLLWTQEYRDLLGVDSSFIPTLESFFGLVHPEDRDQIRSDLRAAASQGAPFQNQFRVTLADGIHWMERRGTVQRDAAGKPVRMIGITSDITEHKRTEEALRRSEQLYRTLVEGLPDTVIRFDRQGRHLFVSDHVRDCLNLEPAALLGRTHRELGLPEALCQFWEDKIAAVFSTGQPIETEFTLDGSRGALTCNWRLVPERGEDGEIKSILSISRDITAYRRLEQEHQTLFREMLDGFALHEIVCDEGGRATDYRFLAVNPAFERMTGIDAGLIVGRTVLEVFPETEPRWIETYGQVALTGKPVFFENYHSGLQKHFEVKAFRPAPNRFACIFVDTTERRRAEAERAELEAHLQQAQKMESIGRLAGGVAHDFNNLLTVINGYASMLLDELGAGEPMRELVDEVHRAGQRAAALTGQLLAFSRKQVLQPRVLDIDRIVGEMRSLLERLVGEDVDLRLSLEAPGATVRADPHQLGQVIMNLVVNARDAMPHGGSVVIATGVRERPAAIGTPPAGGVRCATIAVQDTGVGMDEATRLRIFEPFFTTKGPGRGTGLGLSMVQGIVAQSGGQIDVASVPGHGSTFTIYLPVVTESAAPIRHQASSAGLRGHETILVAEDEPEVREYTTAALQRFGYRPIAAANAGEALLLCERADLRIDLVLTDVVMPHVGGHELLRRLAQIRPQLKVVFMSGYTADAIGKLGVIDPGVAYIQKPFTPEELARTIRGALGSPRP